MPRANYIDQISLFREALSIEPFRTREEENAVCVRAAAGDRRAIDEICRRNTRLAAMIARKRIMGLPDSAFPDLFQEGMLGIVRSLQDFDPGRGLRFSTYATWWMNAYVSRHAHLLRSLVQRVDKVEDAYLDAPLNGDGEMSHLDVLESPLAHPEEMVQRARFDERVRARLKLLEKRLATLSKQAPSAAMDVVEHRLMAGPGDAERLCEIGDRHGLSRERIRQIESQALRVLERAFEDLRDAA
jgi:RNA polymerase sigma factor (sigma-70 family)